MSTDATAPPSKHAARSAATRSALVAAGRELFARRGYADVGTEEIVKAAGVTRGALYHQFADKRELFEAVFEAVEEELTLRLAPAALQAAQDGDPLDALYAAAATFLDQCREPEVERIALVDAPAVLGWQRWREIGLRYALGMTEAILAEAIARGLLTQQPTRPLAHLLLGAIDEAALYVARSEDQDRARTETLAAMALLLDGLRRTA